MVESNSEYLIEQIEMYKLIPRDDYFKHTTRSQMSESEKLQTIEAVERGVCYLTENISSNQFILKKLPNGRQVFQRIANNMVYLRRAVNLIKGSTQPAYLYRVSRTVAVESEARKIANETGADYREVRDLFMWLMTRFIKH